MPRPQFRAGGNHAQAHREFFFARGDAKGVADRHAPLARSRSPRPAGEICRRLRIDLEQGRLEFLAAADDLRVVAAAVAKDYLDAVAAEIDALGGRGSSRRAKPSGRSRSRALCRSPPVELHAPLLDRPDDRVHIVHTLCRCRRPGAGDPCPKDQQIINHCFTALPPRLWTALHFGLKGIIRQLLDRLRSEQRRNRVPASPPSRCTRPAAVRRLEPGQRTCPQSPRLFGAFLRGVGRAIFEQLDICNGSWSSSTLNQKQELRPGAGFDPQAEGPLVLALSALATPTAANCSEGCCRSFNAGDRLGMGHFGVLGRIRFTTLGRLSVGRLPPESLAIEAPRRSGRRGTA